MNAVYRMKHRYSESCKQEVEKITKKRANEILRSKGHPLLSAGDRGRFFYIVKAFCYTDETVYAEHLCFGYKNETALVEKCRIN